jgi:threonine dehydrogenase-like Zn-dependent dehydrogenase
MRPRDRDWDPGVTILADPPGAVEEVPHELGLDEAPAASEKFDQRADGYTKVLLHPAA